MPELCHKVRPTQDILADFILEETP